MKTVTFYFDFGSPATYLAATQLPRIAAETGATIDWRPMLLGGVFKATGNRPPAEVAPKGLWMLRDLVRYAAHYSVPFRFNPHFPVNTLMAMRAVTAVKMHHPDSLVRVVDGVFQAMWVDGKALGDAAVLAETIHVLGLDGAAILNEAATPEVKDQLRTETDGAVARGVFGAPTMFVGDEMFFGQDRLHFVREELAGTAKAV